MSALALQSPREARIRSILDDLLVQRRRLESSSGEKGLLEANRLAISYWEWQLASHGKERAEHR
ncbi:MAG TPA: hypothetical protein VMG74_11035 [Gaiellaceae bacterium]|nr:hypothetical protein [Gaiellaceae bacterium]HUJ55655.1 hypothetical protein [Gaiellaceae bacterium]